MSCDISSMRRSAARHIFNSLLGVSSGDETPYRMLDITGVTKTKTQKRRPKT